MGVAHFVDGQSVAHKLYSVFKAIPKGCVARSVNKFVVIHKEALRATSTIIASYIICPPKFSSECSFHGATTLRDVKLMRGETALQLFKIVLIIFLFPVGIVSHRIEFISAEGLS